MFDFVFTKPDQELIGNKSLRDPLGFQPIWSTLGRKIVYNLTEVSTNVKAFQLLISTFYLYEIFRDRLQNDYSDSDNDIKNQVAGRSAHQLFSLENFFMLTEQAFAYSYKAINYDSKWPLAGSRQVEASYLNNQAWLSKKRQILQSQLANGVWGYYRSAAIRSSLLDFSGQSLLPEIKYQMSKSGLYESRTWRKLFQLVRQGLLENEVEFSLNRGNSLIQLMADIIETLPDKSILYEHLLMPEGRTYQNAFAKYAQKIKKQKSENEKKIKSEGDWRRNYFISAQKEFPDHSHHFKTIVDCEDYIGTLDAIFDWTGQYSGKSPSQIAENLDIDLGQLKMLRDKFSEIAVKELQKYSYRTKLYCDDISLNSKKELVESIIYVHSQISHERNSAEWITISDSGIIVSDFSQSDEDLKMTPGNGWINDYYASPLVSIYEGLR